MRPLRIGLFGLFGVGNYGNDGSLEATLSFLRKTRPDAELTCICFIPKDVERDFSVAALPIRLPGPTGLVFRTANRLLLRCPRILDIWVRTINQVRRFDVLMVPGTGILEELSDQAGGMPLSLFLWCLAARVCGTKIMFASVGAGPVRHPINRWLIKSCARMAQYRSYRNEISREFMGSIGVNIESDCVYPDLAFGLPVVRPSNPPEKDSAPLIVGIGVMAFFIWYSRDVYEAYIKEITIFVKWLIEGGHRIRLLTSDASDRGAVDDLLRNLAKEMSVTACESITAEQASSRRDLMQQIADTDIVIATRFHNVVYALMLDKPTISLGYSKKNDVLLEEMGLVDCCQHATEVRAGRLMDQFTRLLSNMKGYEQSIKRANAAMRDRLEQQEAVLVTRLATVVARG